MEELVKFFTIGQKNPIDVKIFGENLDGKEPSFTFKLYFQNGNVISWDESSENNGGFKYETEEDAAFAALDFIIDHSSFQENFKENLIKKSAFDADLFNLMDENPEDNVEEVPEDFRLNNINVK